MTAESDGNRPEGWAAIGSKLAWLFKTVATWIFLGPIVVVAAVAALATVVTLAMLLAFAVVKGTDVIYSTAYMAWNWNDAERFPPGCEFCKKLYCRNTKTTDKHVAGAPFHQSEVRIRFCYDHARSDLLLALDWSRLGQFLWWCYCACVFASVIGWYYLALYLLARLVAIARSLLRGAKPSDAAETRTDTWLPRLSVGLAVVSCFCYVWW